MNVQPLAEEGVPVERHPLHRGRQPEHGDSAKGPNELQRLVHGVHAADGLDNQVRALASGEVEDRVGCAPSGDVDQLIDAHAPRMIQTLRDRLDGDDVVRADPPQHEVVKQPDRTLTYHRHRLANEGRKPATAENNRPQLLRHQQMGLRCVRRQSQQEMRVDKLVSGKRLGTPDVWDCQHKLALVESGASAIYDDAHPLMARVAMRQRPLVHVPAHVADVEVAAADRRERRPD